MTEDGEEGWKSSIFRQRIVEQIQETQEECRSRVPLQKSAQELEDLVFRRSLDKEMYLSLVARMILFLRTRASGSPPPEQCVDGTKVTCNAAPRMHQDMLPPYRGINSTFDNNWQPNFDHGSGHSSQYLLGSIKQERPVSPRSACTSLQFGRPVLHDGVTKCQKLLSSLLTLMAPRLNSEKRTALRELVQNLLADKTSAENFTEELSKLLKTPPQPHMIPFLKAHLGGLRSAIAQGLLSIEGFNSQPKNNIASWPATQHGQVIPMNGSRTSMGSSSVMPERRSRGRPPTKHLHSSLTSSAGFQDSAKAFSIRNGDRLESQIRSLLAHKVSPLPSPQASNGHSSMTEPKLPSGGGALMQPSLRGHGSRAIHGAFTPGANGHSVLPPAMGCVGMGMTGNNAGYLGARPTMPTHPTQMPGVTNGFTHAALANNGSQRLRGPQHAGQSNGLPLPGMPPHHVDTSASASGSVVSNHFEQNTYTHTGMMPYLNSSGPLPEGAQELLALSSHAPADFHLSTMNMLMSLPNGAGVSGQEAAVTSSSSSAALNLPSYAQSLADADCIVQREGKLLADLSFSRSSRPTNSSCDSGGVSHGPSMWELGMAGGTYGPESRPVMSQQANSPNITNFGMEQIQDGRLLRAPNKSPGDASFESLLLTDLDVLSSTSSQHGEIS